MKKFHFKKIDAFTDGSSGGNPAGYIDLTEGAGLSAAEMQQIAAELKGFVNEVGFLSCEAGTVPPALLFLRVRSGFLRARHDRHPVRPAAQHARAAK